MRGLRGWVAGAAMLALAACSTESKNGVVHVSLAGSPPARAVMFRLVGKHGSLDVPAGQPFRVFPSAVSGDTVTVAVIANQGSTLSGAIVSVQLDDKSVLPTVSLLQVAGSNYSLQSTTLYTLAIAP